MELAYYWVLVELVYCLLGADPVVVKQPTLCTAGHRDIAVLQLCLLGRALSVPRLGSGNFRMYQHVVLSSAKLALRLPFVSYFPAVTNGLLRASVCKTTWEAEGALSSSMKDLQTKNIRQSDHDNIVESVKRTALVAASLASGQCHSLLQCIV